MAGFRQKKPRKRWVKAAVYGPPGAGKTLTSLILAEGLAKASGKRVAFVDTEEGSNWYSAAVPERRVHPDAFEFDSIDTRSLHTVADHIFGNPKHRDGAIPPLDTDQYGVLVIDSITHLWESARNSYTGKKGRGGQLPIQAWGQIKKPYRDLITHLLNLPIHVILCGRQGVDYGVDDRGEQRALGVKMKAESETPYEPDFLFRMEAVRGRGPDAITTLFVEKDRSGVLRGKAIEWPTFDNVVAPLLPYLGNEHGQVQTSDDQVLADAEAQLDAAEHKQRISEQLVTEYKARFSLAGTVEELKTISRELTPARKKTITTDALADIRTAYTQRLEQLGGAA